ncbi:MAG: PIN domain-containing protein [FCB group bacterium]|nr:PIN domain-containing protein [FCB group bacterium]
MDMLVVDVCVLIDLYNGDVLHRFFGMQAEVHISDVQVEEINDEKGLTKELIERYGAKTESHSSEEVARVYDLAGKHGEKRIADLFAFVLAKRLGAILLTGDRKLRTIALNNGLRCHGTLWVLDEMVDRNLLSNLEANNSLKKISVSNSFLPSSEVTKRLRLWQSEK